MKISELNKIIIELQSDQKKLENEQLKNHVTQLEHEVKQLNETIKMMKENEEKIAKENLKYTTDLIQDRIQAVQIIQIELSQKDDELVNLNKKIKNLNYTISIYKENAEKFNKRNK